MDRPLMPKATAVWLVDNTDLRADRGFLRPASARGTGHRGRRGRRRHPRPRSGGRRAVDPRRDRARSEGSQGAPAAGTSCGGLTQVAQAQRPRYTPLSKRQDRPDAIAWLLRHHPELGDQQICKLLGTTKATVNAVRERTHWKSAEIRPRDPVLIGLCSQLDLDAAVIEARAAQRRRSRDMAAAEQALAALDQDDS